MGNNLWKNFLVADISSKIIAIFKDVFLGVYFFKMTAGNIKEVALFYIIFYLSYTISFYIVNKFTRICLMKLFRIGLFLSIIQCFLLLLLGSSIVNYILLFAIFSAIGNAFYYYSQQILIKRVNQVDNFQRYCSTNKIINCFISVIIPIVFGFCIVAGSYNLAFILLIVFTTVSFLISFTIKDCYTKHSKIQIKKFFKKNYTRQDKKFWRLMILKTFYRGLSSFGVLSTLITLLTFLTVSTELELGKITSIITIISILVVYFLNKYVKRNKIYKLFIPISIIQIFAICLLTFCMIKLNTNVVLTICNFSFSLSYIIIIIYNVINGISNPIFEVYNEVIFYEAMNEKKITKDEEPGYVFLFEIIINIARIIGYIILILFAIVGFTINTICFLILLFSFMYIFFAYTLKKLYASYFYKIS